MLCPTSTISDFCYWLWSGELSIATRGPKVRSMAHAPRVLGSHPRLYSSPNPITHTVPVSSCSPPVYLTSLARVYNCIRIHSKCRDRTLSPTRLRLSRRVESVVLDAHKAPRSCDALPLPRDSHGSFAPPQTHLLSRDMERKPVVSDPSCRTSGVWLSLKADGIISIAEI